MTQRTPIAPALLAWFDGHGRTDLPWQVDPTPYRVWISEIMLQQTQVATVIGYFDRFMQALPTLPSLAAADGDQVMALWSGLGYYSRARNLHRAAQHCVEAHDGDLPDDLDALIDLPGIGRSTAGAIQALSRGRRHPILDGNVKRVLARYHRVAGWPGRSAVARSLWEHAEAETPSDRVAAYTQAIMDLGATVCTPRTPACLLCPVSTGCAARARGDAESFPDRKPKRATPQRDARFLVQIDGDGRVLLERRPPSGIWGGLWSLPQRPVDADLAAEAITVLAEASPIEHSFTHFHLRATPLHVEVVEGTIAEGDQRRVGVEDLADLGLPAPVREWLHQLFEDRIEWQEKSTASA